MIDAGMPRSLVRVVSQHEFKGAARGLWRRNHRGARLEARMQPLTAS